MLTEFITKKLKGARYKLLKDGSYFGEIPGLKGVWANKKTLEDCREELRSALEDWLLFNTSFLKFYARKGLAPKNGISINKNLST